MTLTDIPNRTIRHREERFVPQNSRFVKSLRRSARDSLRVRRAEARPPSLREVRAAAVAAFVDGRLSRALADAAAGVRGGLFVVKRVHLIHADTVLDDAAAAIGRPAMVDGW